MTAPEEPIPANDGQPHPSGAPVPPPAPGQQPGSPQPQQPYGSASSLIGQATAPQPSSGSTPQQPYTHQPSGAAPQSPYAQQPYGAPPQPPYPGYPAQPPYPVAPEPPKKKAWPWVLGGCLGLILLASICFVGCMSCAFFATVNSGDRYDGSYGYSDSYDPYDDYDYSYNYDYDSSGYGLTYDDIVDAAGDLPNNNIGGKCTSGVYRVGVGKDIEPGRYFFEGGVDEEGYFTVFESDGKQDSYAIDSAVVYFGNYFADLEEGDLVVFMGADGDRMYRADEADFKPEAPYECGLFRVGVDIPAGTYTVTVQEDAAAVASDECAAFVMKDLDFDDDSITETKYVAKGGTQTVTVKDGDWLELFAATATPTE